MRDFRSFEANIQVNKYFHLPIIKAANTLGVSVTYLKYKCRRAGVDRWPYRKIQSLKNMIKLDIINKDFYEKQIQILIDNPNIRLNELIAHRDRKKIRNQYNLDEYPGDLGYLLLAIDKNKHTFY